MGCGISTMDAEDASLGRRRFNRPRHQHAIAPPIADNNMELDQVHYYILVFELGTPCISDPVLMQRVAFSQGNNNNNNDRNEEAKTSKEELGFNRKEEEVIRVFNIESREKDQKDKKEEHYYVSDHKHAKSVKNVEDDKEENDDEGMDDHFIGPGSPSFSYYCNDYDSVDRSSMTDSINDYCDSDQSTKNGSE